MRAYPSDVYEQIHSKEQMRSRRDRREESSSKWLPAMREAILKTLRREGTPALIRPQDIAKPYPWSWFNIWGPTEQDATMALKELEQFGFCVKMDKDWSNDMTDNSAKPFWVKKCNDKK